MLSDQLKRFPDTVFVESSGEKIPLRVRMPERTEGIWSVDGVQASVTINSGVLRVALTAPQTAVRRLTLRWRTTIASGMRFLGDAWERGYGDLEWRGMVAERAMPWYFLTVGGGVTYGCGVKTGGSSLAYWNVDPEGVTLTLDVRCGGEGVLLGDRTLLAAEVVFYEKKYEKKNEKKEEDKTGLTSMLAAREFCTRLCDAPRLPDHAVYGSNDWYYSYGNSTQASILEDARLTTDLAENAENRPYVTIDAGWQLHESCWGGDWTIGNAKFPDLPGLASSLVEMGTRPGIWMRPLHVQADDSVHWHLPPKHIGLDAPVLDPSIPEVLERVAADFRRLHEWGYKLIKHDFSTYDIFGLWGFEMGTRITRDGWAFHDRSRTSAEIIHDFYQKMRDAAGDSLLIGCNTIGHLGAGLFELQRTGDDTSGREWERTRKMGVNTLAFRMPQHNTFYACDADCVGLTDQIPWALNRQWLDLLARSGTPLFVSAAPDAMGAEQRRALRDAFTIAAASPVGTIIGEPVGIPMDWLETTCPSQWRVHGETVACNWISEDAPVAGIAI